MAADFHTAFNVVTLVFVLPLDGLAALLRKLLPEPATRTDPADTRHHRRACPLRPYGRCADLGRPLKRCRGPIGHVARLLAFRDADRGAGTRPGSQSWQCN